MRTLLYAGVVHRACDVCSEKWPCAKHPEKGVGERAPVPPRGDRPACVMNGVIEHLACPDCGYHVCSCPLEQGGEMPSLDEAVRGYERLADKFRGSWFGPSPKERGAEDRNRRAIELIDRWLGEEVSQVDPRGWHRTEDGYRPNYFPVLQLMVLFWRLRRRKDLGEGMDAAKTLPTALGTRIRWCKVFEQWLLDEEVVEDHAPPGWKAPEYSTRGRWERCITSVGWAWEPAHQRPPKHVPREKINPRPGR